jgi:hypothetical protein
MNCNEFETVVNDLTRKRVMDASLRQETHRHAEACGRCNARLTEEKQLTVGLRALAILAENKKAPADLEANLLAAFRKNGSALPTKSSALASPSMAASRSNRWWLVAAAVLLLFAIAAWGLQSGRKAPEQLVEQQKPQAPSPNHNQEKIPVPDNPTAPDKTADSVVGTRNPKRKAPALKFSPKDLHRLNPQVATNTTTGGAGAPATQETLAQNEITTPFISLTQGYTLAMAEGGQVLRVELPRSALASFGLPVNAQRINEPVKADVVVGNDGIARAIRFVR